MNTHDQSTEAILASAIGIPDPAARRAYRDRTYAGDGALRQEVESFLAVHEQASGFMATTAIVTLRRRAKARPAALIAAGAVLACGALAQLLVPNPRA